MNLSKEQQEFWDLLHLTREVSKDGSIYWRKNGKYHRDDGPAAIGADGSKRFFKNNKLHLDQGPAVIHADGTEQFYKNGELHREDGPAIITKIWYKDGKEVDPF